MLPYHPEMKLLLANCDSVWSRTDDDAQAVVGELILKAAFRRWGKEEEAREQECELLRCWNYKISQLVSKSLENIRMQMPRKLFGNPTNAWFPTWTISGNVDDEVCKGRGRSVLFIPTINWDLLSEEECANNMVVPEQSYHMTRVIYRGSSSQDPYFYHKESQTGQVNVL